MEANKLVNETDSQSVAAAATVTLKVAPPNDEVWRIKELIITPGTNTTVNAVRIDGQPIVETASLDIEAVYGSLLDVARSVEVDVTNNDAGAQTSSLQVKGVA